jgi:hypothetical protein
MRVVKHLRPQLLLLLALNALLFSLLGYEVMALQQHQAVVSVAAPAPLELPDAAQSPVVSARTIEDYAEITNRPLFNRERRPLELQQADQVEEEALNFTLVGVVLTPEQQVAIIYSKKQKQPVKVALWEWIEGWRLVAVAANVVELRKGKRAVELELQRASRPGDGK